MKEIAIIGSTASGKSDLALQLAQEFNGVIFSIDSLSIFKEIDIASAKPSKSELSIAQHFGINVLAPNEHANVFTFIDEYHHAKNFAQAHNQILIIVGGSSFYLKSMLDGLSNIPSYSNETLQFVESMMTDLEKSYAHLKSIDPISIEKIAPNDRYRIEKLLLLTTQTNIPPSQWFKLNPPTPIIDSCPIFDLKIDRELLRKRILIRTHKMINEGVIDEVAALEKTYGRSSNSMKAIGIIETLNYLDGKIDLENLINEIFTHTAQLAKRQQTFNSNQFHTEASGTSEELYKEIKKLLKKL